MHFCINFHVILATASQIFDHLGLFSMRSSHAVAPPILVAMTDAEALKQLQRGYCMPQPDECPVRLHHIMHDCWQKEPQNQSTFKALKSYGEGTCSYSASMHESQTCTEQFSLSAYENCNRWSKCLCLSMKTVTYATHAHA